MKAWENFALVSGYLPEIDRLPATAVKLGLLHRVAAVLNYGDVPHSPMYWGLVEAFVKSLPADSVTFEIEVYNKESLLFTSLSLMRECVEGRPEMGCPFDHATFYVQGRATAFIEMEPYALAGGPWPYCDSWTFAIYRDTDDITRLRDACYRVCAEHGLPVLEEMCGLAAPQEPPWWRRLLWWLLR